MNKGEISEMQRSNWAGISCYSILNAVLVLCYLIEVFKKARTVGYFLVFCLLALVPLAAAIVMYRNDRESETLRYVMSAGYGIFYIFVIFTTVSPVAYVYALIFALVILAFNDMKLTYIFSGGLIAVNIIQVAVMGAQGQIAAADSADVEIRIGSALLFALFLVASSQVLNQNNAAKMKEIEAEKDRSERLMDELLRTSQKITADIEMVSDKMGLLESATSKTMSSMEEVAMGTNDTANSIQLQMEKTEDIHKTIMKVNHASDMIERNIEATQRELTAAQGNIDSLIRHVNQSNEENSHVSKELSELHEYTSQMQSIIHMIDEITTQTSLLSLNASIEAARAGEAGKGFAVVASEISALATQTQAATDNITVLIGNISSELEKVVTVVEGMIDNSNAQNKAANSTAASFEQITASAKEVYQESSVLKELIDELTAANRGIVEGIETISAATEEVTAHSNETFESSAENNEITGQVGSIIEELQQMAQELTQLD